MALAVETRPEIAANEPRVGVLGRVSGAIYDRRTFLKKLPGLGMVGAGAGQIIASALESAVTYTPKRPVMPEKPAGKLIYPGWIGASREVFISGRDGPNEFMRHAIFENPVLNSIEQLILKDFVQAFREGRELSGFREIHQIGLSRTNEVFSSLPPNMISGNVNLFEEKKTAMDLATGMACSGWFSVKQFHLLGVGPDIIPDGKNASDSFYQGINSLGGAIMPRVMADPERQDGPDDEPNFSGKDSARHFFVLKAVRRMVKRSLEDKTRLEESSPNILKAAVWLMTRNLEIKTPSKVASIYTETLAGLYEAKRTLELRYIPIISGKTREEVNAGLFDYGVAKDLQVNAMAMRFGEMVDEARTEQELEALGEKINDPELSALPKRTLFDGLVPGLTAARNKPNKSAA